MAHRSSYKRTSSAQITTKPGTLAAYFVGTNGVINGNIKVYDVDTVDDIADDNCLVDCTVVAANYYGGRNILPDGLVYGKGLYVTLTGAGAFYFVEYK